MKTIPEMFFSVAKSHAKRPAVVDGEKVVLYETLEKRIRTLALRLYRMGIRQGDRVALLLPNGLDFVTGYFAIAAAGAIVVPMNDHYQQTELLYFLDECGVSLLISSKDFAPYVIKFSRCANLPASYFG